MSMWKEKGDVQDSGTSKGIMLRSYVMKVLGRIPDGRIRKCGDGHRQEYQGFRKVLGMMDGMSMLKQLCRRGLRCKVKWHLDLLTCRRPMILSRER